MGRFVSQVFSFLVITIVVILTSIVLTNFFVEREANFIIEGNVDKIVVGNSHSECAFNDTLISNFANFSESGTSYNYSFFKIKKLLEYNPGIDTVFIEFSNVDIEPERDEWIWGDKYLSKRFQTFAPFMGVKDFEIIIRNNSSSVLGNLSLLLRSSIGKLLSGNFDFTKSIGGYKYLKRDKTEFLLEQQEIRKRMVKESSNWVASNDKFSEANLYYLERIIAECKRANVKVYFIRSPMHGKAEKYNEKLYRYMLNKNFYDVEFIDFLNYPLANSDFGDLTHLNYSGAKKFSNFFNELLRKGLLKKPNKQAFIDNEIKKNSEDNSSIENCSKVVTSNLM